MKRTRATTARTLAAIAVLTAGAWGGDVRASAYAFSNNHVTVAFGNAIVRESQRSSGENRAEFGGSPSSTTSAPFDPAEAVSGHLPFADTNVFGPRGRTPEYARADVRIDSNSIFGMEGTNVAEIYRTSPGTANATARTHFDFDLMQTSEQLVTISVFASPELEVATDRKDFASAEVSFVVTFFQRGDDGHQEVIFRWTPGGDPKTDYFKLRGTVQEGADPFDLQHAISCFATCSEHYAEAGLFNIAYGIGTGAKYGVFVDWTERVSVNVPEPPTPVLLLGAIAAALTCAGRRGARRERSSICRKKSRAVRRPRSLPAA